MAETRRSSRIAAQPKKEELPKPARKPSNKRAAGETSGEDAPTKKVRSYVTLGDHYLARHHPRGDFSP
jgi:hypothetical protein